MNSRLLPGLALAGVLVLSGCSGTTSPTPSPNSGATPVDTSIAPPQTGEPSPDAPTTAPAGAVTAANLPTAEDLRWDNQLRWRAGQTSTGGGTEQLSACQQNRLESLGANAIVVRKFTLGDAGGRGASIAMSFDNPSLAEQAYTTVQGWVADCPAVLAAQQRTNPRQTISPRPASVPGGKAQVSEWAYGTTGDEGEFESQGLVQQGDRLALLVLTVPGQDNNFDLEPGGPVGTVHPIITSLPAVATKLRAR